MVIDQRRGPGTIVAMTTTLPSTALQLRSLIQSDGELELSLVDTPLPKPGPDEVLLRIEAAPINPSDLGLLFGAAEMGAAKVSGTAAQPIVKARIPEAAMKAMAGRLGQSMPVGNEGAGLVVAAGSSPAAQALLGKTVAAYGGAMYAQYRSVPVADCLLLPDGTSAAEGASSLQMRMSQAAASPRPPPMQMPRICAITGLLARTGAM